MQSVLLIIHVLAAVCVIGLVLLQQGRGADAGAAFGSGASGSVFGSRGPTTFLTRMTTILVTVFFLTSLSLAWLSGQSTPARSVMERVETGVQDPPSADPAGLEVETGALPAPGAVEGEDPLQAPPAPDGGQQ